MQLRAMSLSALRSVRPQFAKAASLCASALAASLWIATCGAAPEFIWQGLRIALAHPSWTELYSALLIGLILAFFVEPLMEHIRDLLRPPREGEVGDSKPRNVMFTASLSLAFALASVCLHDAIAAFVSGRGSDPTQPNAALSSGLLLVAAWAFVPFTVTLAWLSVWQRWLRVPMGVIGGASSCFAGWLFGWSSQTVITTTIPCLVILGLGYRQLLQEPGEHEFARCARLVVLVAAIWFPVTMLLDAAFAFRYADHLEIYDTTSFWTDVRFYIGWALGLLLAPWPYHRPANTERSA
jgi:hypothetical protein